MRVSEKLFSKLFCMIICFIILTATIGNYNYAATGIDLKDVVGGIDETIDQQSKEFREKEYMNFEKHYSGDLYFTDYTYERYLVNRAYELDLNIHFDKAVKASKPEEVKIFIKPNIVCFNQTLQSIRDGVISVEDVLADEKKYVRSIELSVYYFTTGKVVESEFGYSMFDIRDKYNDLNLEFKATLNGYNKIILDQIALSILKDMKYPRLLLNEYKHQFYIRYFDSENQRHISRISNETGKLRDDQIALKEKYNEDFFIIKAPIEGVGEVFAPVNKPHLEFEVSYTNDVYMKDTYVVVKTQEMVSKRIDQILEVHDAKDKFVFFTTPTGLYNSTEELHQMQVDFNALEDDLYFVNNELPKEPTTTLYYLLEENEEIDYKLLKNIFDDYHRYYPDKKGKNYTLVTYFVRMEADKQKIIISLFNENRSKDNLLRRIQKGLDMTNSIITRVNHEGFLFMDVYGIKEPFIYMVHKSVRDESLESFIDKYKEKGIWR